MYDIIVLVNWLTRTRDLNSWDIPQVAQGLRALSGRDIESLLLLYVASTQGYSRQLPGQDAFPGPLTIVPLPLAHLLSCSADSLASPTPCTHQTLFIFQDICQWPGSGGIGL